MIHGQVPLPVPCYDFALLTESTFGRVKARTSGIPSSLGVTGDCILEIQ